MKLLDGWPRPGRGRPRRVDVGDLVRVECYSGYTYAQEPRAFDWQGQRYQVRHIAKRWRIPAGPAFRVEGIAILDSQSVISLACHPPVPVPQVQAGRAVLQSPISILVDLHYLETEDKWTATVHNSCEEDQR
jgi:hypothetical protein